MGLLRSWSYPGNVRELQNVLERAVALCSGPLVDVADLPSRLASAPAGPVVGAAPPPGGSEPFPGGGINLEALLASAEQGWLVAALSAAGGNKTQAARLLGLSFRSLRYRLAKYGMDSEGE
jgi:two-component system response regulator PilR (NtrC family)